MVKGDYSLPLSTALLIPLGMYSDQSPCALSHLPHSLSPEAYLDMLCPVESRPQVRVPSEPPGGAVSLSKLKGLPVSKQVIL